MTSILERAPASQERYADEDTPRWDVDVKDLAPETNDELAEPSAETPLATQEPIDRATSRVGRFLQNAADKFENGASHADNASERTAELKDRAKNAVKKFGRAAISWGLRTGKATFELGVGATVLTTEAAGRGAKKAGEKIGDATMAGLKLSETVMDELGTAGAEYKNKYQTRQFERQGERDRKASDKEYARDVKQLEKERAQQEKADLKQDKRDAKQLNRDKKDFNKILDKKERQDEAERQRVIAEKERRNRKAAAEARKAERRARQSAKWNTLKSTAASGAEVAGDGFMKGMAKVEKSMDWAGDKMLDAKGSVQDKTERVKRSIHISRAAGRAAIDAFRDARTDLKNNS